MHPTTNEGIFSKITPESAYWIGLLMADGTIIDTRYNPSIALRLGIKDLGHVEKFKAFTNSSNKIHIVKQNSEWAKTEVAHFAFTSKKVAEDLANYGVVPRKSKNAKVAHLENNRDFWRGIIDGDGSISYQSRGTWCLSLVGSYEICEQFLAYCKTIIETNSKVLRHKSIFSVSFTARKASSIIRNLYENAEVYLDRKYKSANLAMLQETHPKLSEVQILEMKSKYRKGSYSYRKLAGEYGVSYYWAYTVINR